MGSSFRQPPSPLVCCIITGASSPGPGQSVVLAQGMSELMIDQMTPVVSQVRSIGIGAEQPTLGVQHHAIAVLT
jgi:hypothetical protein